MVQFETNHVAYSGLTNWTEKKLKPGGRAIKKKIISSGSAITYQLNKASNWVFIRSFWFKPGF
jgi:hypothetical protein